MDSTVITEIANQLGIAVENASQFIEDILPQYATMRLVEMVFVDVMLILLSVAMLVALMKVYKQWHKRNEDDERYLNDVSNFFGDHMLITFICGFVWTISFFVILVFTACSIGWGICPEAMLLDMVLTRVG